MREKSSRKDIIKYIKRKRRQPKICVPAKPIFLSASRSSSAQKAMPYTMGPRQTGNKIVRSWQWAPASLPHRMIFRDTYWIVPKDSMGNVK